MVNGLLNKKPNEQPTRNEKRYIALKHHPSICQPNHTFFLLGLLHKLLVSDQHCITVVALNKPSLLLGISFVGWIAMISHDYGSVAWKFQHHFQHPLEHLGPALNLQLGATKLMRCCAGLGKTESLSGNGGGIEPSKLGLNMVRSWVWTKGGIEPSKLVQDNKGLDWIKHTHVDENGLNEREILPTGLLIVLIQRVASLENLV